MGKSEKREFTVSIPIAGALHISVTAKNAKEAEAAAWEVYHEKGPDAGDVEWEAYDRLTEGNVLHVPQNTVEVHNG